MLITLAISAQLLAATPDSTPTPASPTLPLQGRARAVEVSEWYGRRLALHRWTTYATIPAFAFQWTAGRQLWDKGPLAPGWARTGHRVGAGTIGALFAINAVTGAWNLWDLRAQPVGRARRYAHAASMLTATAGFAYAGAKLSVEAKTDVSKREQHRTVALSSTALTLVGGLLMKVMDE